MSLFTHGLPDGQTFLAEKRLDPDWVPYGNHEEDEIRAMVNDLWRMAVRGRRGQLERWKRNDMYFHGFHWDTAERRRANSTTNFCQQQADLVWSILTDGRPRPEVVPAVGMKAGMAQQIQSAAKWMMNANQFDAAVSLNIMETVRLGTAPYLLVFDDLGICWPKAIPVYHYYPDPAALNDDELEFFFIARPWSTRLLRSKFPDFANLIFPDGLVSPEYDAIERPLMEEAGDITGRFSMSGVMGDMIGPASAEGAPTLPGGARFVEGLTAGPEWRETTFLLELHIKDHTSTWVTYAGNTRRYDPDASAFVVTNDAAMAKRPEYVCEGGWRVIPMTAGGLLLPDFPVDASLMGSAVEVQRYRQVSSRYWGTSLLDNTVPINRDYNQHLTMLKRSAAFASIPTLRVDKNAGTDLDEAPLEPGDIVKANPGAAVDPLKIGAPGQGHFELVETFQTNLQRVGGVSDAMIGRQPGSAETGVAIRELQQGGESRVKANENQLFFTLKRLLKKCLNATGRKLNRAIAFKAADGRIITLDPEALRHEYDIEYTMGSGTAPGRRQIADQALAFAGAGIIDPQAVLEATDYPNSQAILQRMAMAARMQAAQGGEPGKETKR